MNTLVLVLLICYILYSIWDKVIIFLLLILLAGVVLYHIWYKAKNNTHINLDDLEPLPGHPMHNERNGYDNLPHIVEYNRDFKRYAPHISGKVNDFNVIDFETANNFPDSVCQLGITVVRKNKVIETISYYIKPPYYVFTNTHIHGIDAEKVADCPDFGQLWPEIKEYFENKIIASYNITFDAGCLEALFKCYEIDRVAYAAFDILDTARDTWSSLHNHKLVTVSQHLNISLNAHDAKSDVEAAATVQIIANIKHKYFVKVYCQRVGKNLIEKLKDELLCGSLAYEKAESSVKDTIHTQDIGDYAEPINLFKKAIETSDSNNLTAKSYRALGELYEQCNMLNDAIDCYQKALSYNNKVGVKRKLFSLLKGNNKPVV